MFTGLVRERGRIVAPPEAVAKGGVVLHIGHSEALGAMLEIGASLAVSGVCLTVVTLAGSAAGEASGGMVSTVELSPETLRRTTLGELGVGDEVNLEPAMRMGDPLGGHWVQGHVDTTIEVLTRRDLGTDDTSHRELAFALPAAYRNLVVEKGSVTLDGVSLTVATVDDDRFSVALIPHTLDATTLGQRVPGDRVQLEIDVLAKYVERAVAPHLARVGKPTPERDP